MGNPQTLHNIVCKTIGKLDSQRTAFIYNVSLQNRTEQNRYFILGRTTYINSFLYSMYFTSCIVDSINDTLHGSY